MFLSETLSHERIGLLPVNDRYYRVYFAAVPLALFDSYKLRIQPLPADEDEDDES